MKSLQEVAEVREVFTFPHFHLHGMKVVSTRMAVVVPEKWEVIGIRLFLKEELTSIRVKGEM